jgi:hypothetical protein
LKQILEAIAVTAELMGTTVSPIAAAAMAQRMMAKHPKALVLQALNNLSEDSRGRFTLGAVLEKLEAIDPNKRIGAEEAWAMIPKNEADSAVLTNEMLEAMGAALGLLDEGDKVGARMAFKEAYGRITDAAKSDGKQPQWFPSLGHDKAGRTPALAEAVRLGRLQSSHALKLVAPEHAETLLQLAGEKVLALEYAPDVAGVQRIKSQPITEDV